MGVAGFAVIDGRGMPLAEAGVSLTDPGYTHGWAAYETLVASPGHDPVRNLTRLASSARALEIPMPDEALLRAEIEEVRTRLGGHAWIRIDLTGGGRRIVWGTPVDPARRHGGVRAARAPHVDHPLLAGSVKHRSRAPWMAEVRRRGVDEVLFVDAAGRFTEGTSCAVVAIVAGRLLTAPWDGRILRSTTLESVLERAERLGVPIDRSGPPAAGPWDGLYVASTTRDLAPVVSLDGEALAGWEPIGRALADAA